MKENKIVLYDKKNHIYKIKLIKNKEDNLIKILLSFFSKKNQMLNGVFDLYRAYMCKTLCFFLS